MAYINDESLCSYDSLVEFTETRQNFMRVTVDGDFLVFACVEDRKLCQNGRIYVEYCTTINQTRVSFGGFSGLLMSEFFGGSCVDDAQYLLEVCTSEELEEKLTKMRQARDSFETLAISAQKRVRELSDTINEVCAMQLEGSKAMGRGESAFDYPF